MFLPKQVLRLIVCVLPLVLAGGALASDLAKEKRWAEQVTGDLFDGEVVMLTDGGNEFLTIWTEAEEPKQTAIIVMHGIGVHPDWPQVINPLRVALSEQGWSTLSIQLPILGNDAEGEDYLPLMSEVPTRVDASVKYLHEAGYTNVAIVAHSLGAQMATHYLSHARHEISAFVGIGMNRGNAENLSQIKLPILDLFGENDLEGVLDSAKSRQQAGQSNTAYQQKMTPEAEHFYDGFEAPLIEAVSGWLGQL